MDLGRKEKIDVNPKEHQKLSEWGRVSFEDSPLVIWSCPLVLKSPALKSDGLSPSFLISSKGVHY